MCKIYESFCLIYHYQSLSINFYWLFILFFCWTDVYQHYQRKQGKLIYKVLFLQVGLPHYTWLGRYKHLLCIYDIFFFSEVYYTFLNVSSILLARYLQLTPKCDVIFHVINPNWTLNRFHPCIWNVVYCVTCSLKMLIGKFV